METFTVYETLEGTMYIPNRNYLFISYYHLLLFGGGGGGGRGQI